MYITTQTQIVISIFLKENQAFSEFWVNEINYLSPFVRILGVIRYKRLDIIPPTHEYLTFYIYYTLSLNKVIRK